MANVGTQSFWVTGSRLIFRRNAIAGVKQPTLDLGVIQVISPTFSPTKIELKDSDGGIKNTVDIALIEKKEAVKVTCNNLNLANLNLMFLGRGIETFTQGTTPAAVAHFAYPAGIIKIVDANDLGMFALTSVDFMCKTTAAAVQSITSGTSTIVISGNLTATYTVGKKIALTGAPGTLTTQASAIGNSYEGYIKDTDWTVVDLTRGTIRCVAGGSVSSSGNDVIIRYTPSAVTGARLISPQAISGDIRGKAWVFWGRDSNAQQTVREYDTVVTPDSANFRDDNYSDIALNFDILYNPALTYPAGRLLQFVGALPNDL